MTWSEYRIGSLDWDYGAHVSRSRTTASITLLVRRDGCAGARTLGHHPPDECDELWRDREVTLQQPMVRRAVEEVHDHVDVRVDRNLSALNRSIHHRAVLFAHRLHHSLSPTSGQLQVCLRFGNETDQGAPRRCADDGGR